MKIDKLTLANGATLGMTHCPGRRGIDGDGKRWERSLDADLAAIKASGASLLVSLVEGHEFARLGVPDIGERVNAMDGLRWLHLPVTDMAPPGVDFIDAFRRAESVIHERLDDGDSLVLHCAAGLGRTGTVAASLLIYLGETPSAAVARVRAARPGTIETEQQLRYVMAGAMGARNS